MFRYPLDIYDREWKPISLSFGLTFINTSLNVNSSTPYQLPQEVISKAISQSLTKMRLRSYLSTGMSITAKIKLSSTYILLRFKHLKAMTQESLTLYGKETMETLPFQLIALRISARDFIQHIAYEM